MNATKNSEQLTLTAMRKELKVLNRKASKAAAEVDEYMNVGSEIFAIRRELRDVVKSGEHGHEALKKLAQLKKRESRCERVQKKDLLQLIDKQVQTEIERDSLLGGIQMLEFKISMRHRA